MSEQSKSLKARDIFFCKKCLVSSARPRISFDKFGVCNGCNYLEKRNKFAWWMGIIYIYAMIDAIVDAHLHSFDGLMESPLEKENSKGKHYAE